MSLRVPRSIMSVQFFCCNAFTSVPFRGNPATVCLRPSSAVARALTPERMKSIAGELTLVESAFVLPPKLPKSDFSLRFFTRAKEMTFCGHATLAAAHIVCQEVPDFADATQVLFGCENGSVVIVKRLPGGLYELDLKPSLPSPLVDASLEKSVRAALGLQLAGPEVKALLNHPSSKNLIVVLQDASTVIAVKPDSAKIVDLGDDYQKVTVTAIPRRPECNTAADKQSSSVDDGLGTESQWLQYDFVSRLFAPRIGIAEDAVSGATHAILAQYWSKQPEALRRGDVVRAFQASTRGGEINMVLRGKRVGVAGSCVVVARGVLTVRIRSNM